METRDTNPELNNLVRAAISFIVPSLSQKNDPIKNELSTAINQAYDAQLSASKDGYENARNKLYTILEEASPELIKTLLQYDAKEIGDRIGDVLLEERDLHTVLYAKFIQNANILTKALLFLENDIKEINKSSNIPDDNKTEELAKPTNLLKFLVNNNQVRECLDVVTRDTPPLFTVNKQLVEIIQKYSKQQKIQGQHAPNGSLDMVIKHECASDVSQSITYGGDVGRT